MAGAGRGARVVGGAGADHDAREAALNRHLLGA